MNDFDAIIENANEIYDEWFKRETKERLQRETEALENLHKQRFKSDANKCTQKHKERK
jgi:hypothetical protein